MYKYDKLSKHIRLCPCPWSNIILPCQIAKLEIGLDILYITAGVIQKGNKFFLKQC